MKFKLTGFQYFASTAALTLVSAFATSYYATAQTTNPQLNQLLNQSNVAIDEAQQLVDSIESKAQQQEAYLKYWCYQQGNLQACSELQLFYQRRMQGYNAGINYLETKQNSGWADSFGLMGN